MYSTAVLVSALAAAAAVVNADSIVSRADAPTFTQCAPVSISWAESKAPYNVNISASTNGFSQIFTANENKLTWVVKAPVDSEVSFLVVDAEKAASGGGPFKVVKGANADCLDDGPSSDTIPAAPSSTTTTQAPASSTTPVASSSSSAAEEPTTTKHVGLLGGILGGVGGAVDDVVDHLVRREIFLESLKRDEALPIMARNAWETRSNVRDVLAQHEKRMMRKVQRDSGVSKLYAARAPVETGAPAAN